MDYGYFNETKVSSFTLRRSKVSKIDAQTFSGTESTLTTLDLSNNQISEYPNEAFSKLPLLQWISLKANHISDIKVTSPSTLRTLLLSDNQLTVIQEQAFSDLQSLESLEIDGNGVTKIEGRPFASSLSSLSLAHNLLDRVPIDALHNLNNIKWLQFRGNLIKQLPHQWSFPVSNIEILDLSHNLIASLSQSEFTSKVLDSNITVEVLHLDFNFIESLENDTFASVSIQLLSLSNNKISRIDANAFKGPLESEMKTLDLNNNLLETYPSALTRLMRITSLYLRGNGLHTIPHFAFESMKRLQALDLSSNRLRSVPWRAFSTLRHLLKVNLEDNEIEAIFGSDFKHWSETLISLSLSRNGIKSIEKDTFKHLKHLKELRLSYNNIIHCSLETFIPLRHKLSTFEVSYAFNVSSEKVLQIIAFFENIEWLECDHNALHTISRFALKPSLIHLDVEGNHLQRCDFLLSSDNNTSKLRNVILSYNKCDVIKSKSFDSFRNLITVVLLANKLRTIESYAFSNLPQLQTVVLTKNNIESIAKSAFFNCSALLNVYLQENKLKQLNVQVFSAITSRLYINATHNEIVELVIHERRDTRNITETFISSNNESISTAKNESSNAAFSPVNIRVLDVSNNNISHLPAQFSDEYCAQLNYLDISFNALSELSFESLRNCSQLVSLLLSNNRIADIALVNSDVVVEQNSSCCESLYSLNLASNELRNISSRVIDVIRNVRILDVSDNQISIVEQDAFANSSVQKLNLAGNKVSNKSFNFLETLQSVRHLDLSNNFLREIPVEVKDCVNLIELNLQNNKIDELKERFLGTKVDRISILNLSQNPLRKVHSKAFLSHPQLRTLKLMKSNLTAVPFLPLPNLASIDLSHNHIANISASSLSRARRLKWFDLNNNLLNEVPQHLWRYFPSLIDVNIAYNPIDILDTTCFVELKRLRNIDIRGLNLKFIDSRLLHSHR
ncbi:chaoptin-like protein [Leptotrombidium deliense]|uniref:Chaoptin-like protein n=1 Tax=Leptotrombidium deliense TaxID=299467 RepID=A0A443SK78_9ACAR|nr:chaoptin-like protein [Leptotrombidium deliense]